MKTSTLCLALALGLAGPAGAQSFHPLVYEGTLAQDGQPLEGMHVLTFAVFAESQGAGPLCSHAIDVVLDRGWFATTIDGCAPAHFAGPGGRWLEITVDDGPPLAPRQRVGAVPSAWHARDLVDGCGTSRTIDADLTLQVVPQGAAPDGPCVAPADLRFASIRDALRWLRDKEVLSGATVTIQVADGVYEHDAVIDLDHRDGDKIRIVGDDEQPSNVRLVFRGTAGGFSIERGRRFGVVTGLHLVYEGEPPAGVSVAGVHASRGAYVEIGNLVIEAFPYTGLFAGSGATIFRDGDTHDGILELRGSGVGIIAQHRAYVHASGARIHPLATGVVAEGAYVLSDGTEVEGGTNYGFLAYRGGIIRAVGARVTETDRSAFQALYHSLVVAPSATAGNPRGAGFYADRNSTIDAAGASATGSRAGDGIHARMGSVVDAQGVTASNNFGSGVVAIGGSVVQAADGMVAGNRESDFDPAPQPAAVGSGGLIFR